MSFRKGDRVLCTEEYHNYDIVGKKGTVIWVGMSYHSGKGEQCMHASVQFDRRIQRGHQGMDSKGKLGCCWNIPFEKLIPLKEPEKPDDDLEEVVNKVVDELNYG